jgi:hypothetical protein
MKRPFLVFAIAMLAGLAAPARGQDSGFGLGVIIGEPTGISAKAWQSRTTAIDFAAAWSFVDDTAFHLHADFLVHHFGAIRVDKGKLPLYYGFGARVKFRDDDDGDDSDAEVGIRFPFGIDYLVDGAPLDVFVEVVPILDLAPDTDVEINASLGFRYWFD